MYARFGLTLMVTHACNLRCTYCYTGTKFQRRMPTDVGMRAIDRAIASLSAGGTLELAFFGGEPLLEAELIEAFIAHARSETRRRGLELSLAMTTNGTITTPVAWAIMTTDGLDLSISCDGVPHAHDRHRITAAGAPTSAVVIDTIRRLVAESREFHVIAVVRPDTAEELPGGIAFLADLGVRSIQLSLDLWTRWTAGDIARLERVIARCADVWRLALPAVNVSWFDEKAIALARLPFPPSPRCGFGCGEIAVAPSGRLYPCERLIGEDAAGQPMRLPGHALDGADFLNVSAPAARSHPSCAACAMEADCNTTCRCSNYVRTGDATRPDALLCRVNQACMVETARILNGPVQISVCVGEHHGIQETARC